MSDRDRAKRRSALSAEAALQPVIPDDVRAFLGDPPLTHLEDLAAYEDQFARSPQNCHAWNATSAEPCPGDALPCWSLPGSHERDDGRRSTGFR